MNVEPSGNMRVVRFVAVASSYGVYGGPYDTAVAQVKILTGEGVSAHVIAGTLNGEIIENSAVKTYPVQHLLKRSSFVDIWSFSAAKNVWREVIASDIVHISFARELTPIFALVAGIILKRAVVLQPHGMLTSRTSRAHQVIDAIIVRPLARRADVLIALTKKEQEELYKWHRKRSLPTHIVSNPVVLHYASDDLESSLPPRNVLFAARLHPRKRVVDFADAAKIAAGLGWVHDNYIVHGPDEGDSGIVEEASRDCANLEYLGATDQKGVQRALKAARVFVLPSRNEPWGNVVAAALLLGRPVVVARSAALSDAIESSGAGIIVDDEAPSQIAHAVHRLMDDHHWRDYSERARALGTTLVSSEVIGRKLLDAYTEALS